MATALKRTTAEDLLAMTSTEGAVELVLGELISMPPTGFEHARIAGHLLAALGGYVLPSQLGVVLAAEGGFVLARNPDTVRAPDVAFMRAERVPERARREGFFEGAPDLAVEVVSPGDTDERVHAKVLDCLRAGSNQVWVVRPRLRTVTVRLPGGHARVLTGAHTPSGGDPLPGFELQVAWFPGE